MSNENNPMVSVVMATFNEPPKYVSLAIESILTQSYQNFELLIADDSTKPETIAAIDKYSGDSRVQILRETSRLGFVLSLNKCLKLSKGEFIARMDGDDISISTRFEKQVERLLNDATIDVLGGNTRLFIGNTDNCIGEKRYPQKGFSLRLRTIFRSPVSHPTVMFRRSIIDAGFQYDESFKKAEDIDFWLKLMKNHYKFENLDDFLLNFRRSDSYMDKRTGEHLKCNLRARSRNFDWRHPIFSTMSCLVALLLFIVPKQWYSYVYNKFDRKQKAVS